MPPPFTLSTICAESDGIFPLEVWIGMAVPGVGTGRGGRASRAGSAAWPAAANRKASVQGGLTVFAWANTFAAGSVFIWNLDRRCAWLGRRFGFYQSFFLGFFNFAVAAFLLFACHEGSCCLEFEPRLRAINRPIPTLERNASQGEGLNTLGVIRGRSGRPVLNKGGTIWACMRFGSRVGL